jgi:immune inhibitor A
MKRKFIAIFSILVLLVATLPVFAGAAPNNPDEVINLGANTDNPSHPLGDKQAELRAKGFEAKVNGKTNGPVAEVAKGQFVELERQGEDSIWTVLGEFGPLDHPAPVLFSGIPGPLHNEIPEPDRSVDNTTIWAPDFTEAYYEEFVVLRSALAQFRCAISTSRNLPTAIRSMAM